MKNVKKLPEGESTVMMAIWDSTPPVSRHTVSALLGDKWADTTILTMLSRLVKKGYLSCEKQGNKNLYTPLVSKDDYMLQESTSLGKKARDISLTKFVAAFVENRGITDEEIDELEKMIADFRANNK